MRAKISGQTFYASIGDIATSKLWASVDFRPWRRQWAWPWLGKTYCGTRAGIVCSFGPVVIIAHAR